MRTSTNQSHHDMNIINYIKNRLAEPDRYTLTSDIPADQIAIFKNSLFFKWQKEVAECAEAVRQVVKAEGKRYFIIVCHTTFTMEEMRYILESGLARIAGHAFVDEKTCWDGILSNEGAAIVFELI